MLRSIALENFKAYERLEELELRPLTVFCGPNGVGKSTVIQALLMMQQTIKQQPEGKPSSVVTDGESVSLGDWVDLLFGHDSERAMSVKLNVPLTWGVHGFWEKPATLTLKLEYATRLSDRNAEPGDWDTFRTRIDGPELSHLGLIAKEDNGQDLVAVSITQDANQFSWNDKVTSMWGERIQLTFGERMECSDRLFGDLSSEIPDWEPGPRIEPTERWFEMITPDGVTLTEWNDGCGAKDLVGLVSRMLYEVSSHLAAVRYVGPAREIPQRYYDAGGISTPTGPKSRGERDWKADFANAGGTHNPPSPPGSPPVLMGPMAGMISSWLSYLGLPEVHPVLAGRDMRFMVSSCVEGCSVSVADTGYGVSQVLPVLLAGLFAREGEVLILDQPELHLHPRVQAGMADFAVAFAKRPGTHVVVTRSGEREEHHDGHQVLVETHSDHFVNRIVRRVVEGEIDGDDVAVYFVTPTSDGPHVEMVELDPIYGIKNWPLGFFDDYANDQAEILRASIERRRGRDE